MSHLSLIVINCIAFIDKDNAVLMTNLNMNAKKNSCQYHASHLSCATPRCLSLVLQGKTSVQLVPNVIRKKKRCEQYHSKVEIYMQESQTQDTVDVVEHKHLFLSQIATPKLYIG